MKKNFTVIKIFSLLFLNFSVFFIESPIFLISVLLILLAVGLLMEKDLGKRLGSILPAAILIILFQLIFNTSIPFEQRAILGFLAATRLIIISVSVLLFLRFTSLYELGQAFLFLPKSALLVLMMTFYFIPGILKEAEEIKAVQKSRGQNINSWNMIAGLASLLIPLLHRVFRRAEILSFTLLSRGYEE